MRNSLQVQRTFSVFLRHDSPIAQMPRSGLGRTLLKAWVCWALLCGFRFGLPHMLYWPVLVPNVTVMLLLSRTPLTCNWSLKRLVPFSQHQLVWQVNDHATQNCVSLHAMQQLATSLAKKMVPSTRSLEYMPGQYLAG